MIENQQCGKHYLCNQCHFIKIVMKFKDLWADDWQKLIRKNIYIAIENGWDEKIFAEINNNPCQNIPVKCLEFWHDIFYEDYYY